MRNIPFQRAAILAAKIGISLLLLAYLAAANAFDGFGARLGQAEWPLVCASLFLVVLQVLVGAQRWRLVAKAFSVQLPLQDFVRLSFIGLFFNLTPTGMIGADAAKSWYLAKTRTQFARALNSVLADRILTFIILSAFVIIGSPLLHGILNQTLGLIGLYGFIVAFASGFFGLLAFPGIQKYFPQGRLMTFIGDLSLACRQITFQPRQAGPVYVSGFLAQILSIASIVVLFSAFGVQYSIVTLSAVIPFVLMFAMIPLSVAGWGIREGAMVHFCGYLGISAGDATSVSVTYGLITVLVSLWGCVPWLAARSES